MENLLITVINLQRNRGGKKHVAFCMSIRSMEEVPLAKGEKARGIKCVQEEGSLGVLRMPEEDAKTNFGKGEPHPFKVAAYDHHLGAAILFQGREPMFMKLFPPKSKIGCS